MRHFSICSALLFLCLGTAQANSLSLDVRGDYSTKTYENSPLSDNSRFYFRTGRLDYRGEMNEETSFRVRLAFNKATTVSATDGAHQALELAYITQAFNDVFSLTVGRLQSEIGGFEGATSSADLYLLSEAYSTSSPLGTFGGTAGSATALYGTSPMLYMTGAKIAMKIGDNYSLSLVAVNEKNDESAASTDQNGVLTGAIFKASYLDKSLQFLASYHMMNGSVADNKYQWMAFGAQWTGADISVSADYLINDHTVDSPASGKDQVASFVAKMAYTGLEQWTPRLEFTSSKLETEITSNATRKWMGYGAVIEFKPYPEKNFRYHIAYSNIVEEPNTGSNITQHEVIVGTRLMADFLK